MRGVKLFIILASSFFPDLKGDLL
uniref:Uncharacterized protein n=1 Tax=Nelumbo nucifera TaxID=4432 RepID=A0A822XGE7_NELNU|nr:TPA_asm: hypothetical protein HUJ06_020216 [Nelumbo nucifera]